MDEHKASTRSHLFTVRLWVDQSQEAAPAWYGKVQDMEDGHIAYFTDWQALLAALKGMVDEPSAHSETAPQPSE